MWTIVRLTILETWRRRLLALTAALTAAFLALFWFIARGMNALASTANGGLAGAESPVRALFAHYEYATLAMFLGFFFVYFLLAFFSIFSLAGAISGEAESGLLAAMLPRPLRRSEFLLGKWAGFAIVQLIYVAVLCFGVAFITHIVFPGVTLFTVHLAAAWAVLVLESWTLSAFTILGSVRLSSLANGISVAIMFAIAFLLGSAEQLVAGVASTVSAGGVAARVVSGIDNANAVLSLLFPADSLYRRALADLAGSSNGTMGLLGRFMGPFGVSSPPGGAFVAYAAVYVAGLLSLAVWAFRRRDL